MKMARVSLCLATAAPLFFLSAQASAATYSYDGARRLTEVVSGATTVTYAYDGEGALVRRCVNGACTDIVSTSKSVVGTGAGDMYAFGPGGPAVVSLAGGALAYSATDQHGSIVAAVPATTNAVSRRAYDAYGNTRATAGAQPALGYTGEYTGLEDQTVWLRARAYSPSVGRFLQHDSYAGRIDRPSSLNRYAYTENEPLDSWDPSGRMKLGYTALDGTLVHTKTYLQALTVDGKPLFDGQGMKVLVLHGHGDEDGPFNHDDYPTFDNENPSLDDVADWARGEGGDALVCLWCKSGPSAEALGEKLAIPTIGIDKKGFETRPGMSPPGAQVGAPWTDYGPKGNPQWSESRFKFYGTQSGKGTLRALLAKLGQLDRMRGNPEAGFIDFGAAASGGRAALGALFKLAGDVAIAYSMYAAYDPCGGAANWWRVPFAGANAAGFGIPGFILRPTASGFDFVQHENWADASD